MTQAGTSPQSRITLSAPPPVRALAIAGSATVLGAVLAVLTSAQGWSRALGLVGVVLLVLGVLLAVVAALLTARARSTVTLGPAEVSVTRGRRTGTLPWSGIEEVTLDGSSLRLVSREPSRSDLVVVNPRTPSDPTFRALLIALQAHLDADRGYQPFT